MSVVRESTSAVRSTFWLRSGSIVEPQPAHNTGKNLIAPAPAG